MKVMVIYAAFVTGRVGVYPTAFEVEIEGRTIAGALELIYHTTNTFGVANEETMNLWKKIIPQLRRDRSHTSVSVEDIVIVDGHPFRCAMMGWDYMGPGKDPRYS